MNGFCDEVGVGIEGNGQLYGVVPACGDEKDIGGGSGLAIFGGLHEGDCLEGSIVGEGLPQSHDIGLELYEVCPSDDDIGFAGEVLKLHDQQSSIHFREVEAIESIASQVG